jgi:peroxiredoxin Q/BCP
MGYNPSRISQDYSKESNMLKEGATAPAFKTKDANGNTVSLKDFRGQKVVLYFYPKDDTPGCT